MTKVDDSLKPFLALEAFPGLPVAELQPLDWSGGGITVAAHKAKTRQRRLVPIGDPKSPAQVMLS